MSYYEDLDKEISAFKIHKKVACHEGCSHCCKNLTLNINIIEIPPIVDELNNLQDSHKQTIYQNIQNLDKKYNPSLPQVFDCPFLINNTCSVYNGRPIICRSMFSSDESSCKNHTGLNEIIFPISQITDKKYNATIGNNVINVLPYRAIDFKNGRFISLV